MIVKLLAFLLILGAVHFSRWAAEHSAPVWIAVAVTMAACGIGLLFRHAWARYLWYVLAAAASGWWVLTTVLIALNGWPMRSIADSVVGLIPGVLLLVVCIGGSMAVRRDYRTLQQR